MDGGGQGAFERAQHLIRRGLADQHRVHRADDDIAVRLAAAVARAGNQVGNGVTLQVGVEQAQVLPQGIFEGQVARGRYLGLVLFGAQQFRSQVDRQVVGNCSTALYGRIEMEELAQPGYAIFGDAAKEKLGALAPGEMLVRHPYFNQPIFVRFPRPALMRGQDGLQHYPAAPDLPLEDAVWQNLRQLDPALPRAAVADLIARTRNGTGEPDRERVIEAMHKVLVSKPAPETVLQAFEHALPKAVPVRRVENDFILTDAPPPVDIAVSPLDDEEDNNDPFRF